MTTKDIKGFNKTEFKKWAAKLDKNRKFDYFSTDCVIASFVKEHLHIDVKGCAGSSIRIYSPNENIVFNKTFLHISGKLGNLPNYQNISPKDILGIIRKVK